MVFGILRQVAVRARVGNLLDDTRPLDLLAVLEFALERGIALCRHRDLVHLFLQTSDFSQETIVPIAGRSVVRPRDPEPCPKHRQAAGPGCPDAAPK